MKKILMNLMLTVSALACIQANAQTKPVVPQATTAEANKSYFEVRTDLVKKYGTSNSLSMGWYTGGVDTLEIRDLWNNYTLLSNYLSEKLGRLVVLETDKSDREIASDALTSMDIVYTSGVMGSELMKAGWRPVVGRTEDIQGVILVLNDTVIKEPKDLAKYKIYGVKGATVTYFVSSGLVKNNVYKVADVSSGGTNPKFKIVNTKQNQLVDLLKSKEVDGVIVRETLANKLIKDNPGKYKIGFKADTAPGHIIFVSPNITEVSANIIRDSFLTLTPDNPAYKKILSGLDGYQDTDKVPFKTVGSSFLPLVDGVIVNSGEKPLVKASAAKK